MSKLPNPSSLYVRSAKKGWTATAILQRGKHHVVMGFGKGKTWLDAADFAIQNAFDEAKKYDELHPPRRRRPNGGLPLGSRKTSTMARPSNPARRNLGNGQR